MFGKGLEGVGGEEGDFRARFCDERTAGIAGVAGSWSVSLMLPYVLGSVRVGRDQVSVYSVGVKYCFVIYFLLYFLGKNVQEIK